MHYGEDIKEKLQKYEEKVCWVFLRDLEKLGRNGRIQEAAENAWITNQESVKGSTLQRLSEESRDLGLILVTPRQI